MVGRTGAPNIELRFSTQGNPHPVKSFSQYVGFPAETTWATFRSRLAGLGRNLSCSTANDQLRRGTQCGFLKRMKGTSYAVLVATLVVGAAFIRVCGPNNYHLTLLSGGIERGVPVKIVGFWLLVTIVIGIAILGLSRRRHVG